MRFSTIRETKKRVRSWEHEDDDEDHESKAMIRLRRELLEKEKIKEERQIELAREASILDETRGEINETTWPKIGNTLIYIDLEVGTKAKGRMLFEVFEKRAPKFCRTFLSLIDADAMKGSVFSRIEPGIKCTTAKLSYRGGFDQHFRLKHTNTGLLTASPSEPSTFSILFEEQPQLDGRSLVFGRLIHGFAILRAIESLAQSKTTSTSSSGASTTLIGGEFVRISDCAIATKHDSLQATLDAYEAPLVLPKIEKDLKNIARNYRNKTNYYDTSSRSALFSWTTST